MASSINVNQNNNTVSLQDQNRKITITDNVHEKTVNITQPITSVVSVNTGAQGIQGIAGTNRQNILTTDVLARHITASGDISSSGGTVTALSGSFSHIQVTGALTGTASFSITASHAISASVEITKEISSSNADTASYVKADSIDQPFTTITASGNITASGTIKAPNLSKRFTYIYSASTTAVTDIAAGNLAVIDTVIDYILINTSSLNGVDLDGSSPGNDYSNFLYNEIGSLITLRNVNMEHLKHIR